MKVLIAVLAAVAIAGLGAGQAAAAPEAGVPVAGLGFPSGDDG